MNHRANAGRAAPDPRRRSLVLRAVAGVALPTLGLAACAAPRPSGPVRQFGPPRVAVGDRWHYREINRYNQLPMSDVEVSVTSASPLVCSVRRRRTDTTAGEIARPEGVQEERYSSAWVVDVEPTYDMTMDFAQPMPLLPASLQTGAAEAHSTRYTVRGISGDFRWDQRLRAVGVERVTTAAGTFDCLLVRRTIRFEYPDVFRFGSTRVDSVWYAPEVNRWVQREWTGEYHHENSLDENGNVKRREDWVRWELVSYRPAAGVAG